MGGCPARSACLLVWSSTPYVLVCFACFSCLHTLRPFPCLIVSRLASYGSCLLGAAPPWLILPHGGPWCFGPGLRRTRYGRAPIFLSSSPFFGLARPGNMRFTARVERMIHVMFPGNFFSGWHWHDPASTTCGFVMRLNCEDAPRMRSSFHDFGALETSSVDGEYGVCTEY